MIGQTLFWYFFRRQLAMIFMVVGGILIVAYLVDFTEFARRAGAWPEYTLARGIYLSAMRMPMITMLIWPFVVLFAAMGVLISLNRRNELVIARSSGVSAWQFLAPICLASLLVGIGAVALINPIATRALSAVEELETTFRGYTPNTSDALTIPWLRQRTDNGVTVIGAGTSARRGVVLGDVVFLQFDNDGNLIERYDARNATLGDGVWLLQDVTLTDSEREKHTMPTARIPSSLTAQDVEQRLADAQTISVYELPEKARLAETLGLSGDRFLMQFHSLVALPALLVAMTLIAATVTLRFVRSGQSGTMILGGILAGFLLYVTLVVVTAFGNVGFVPPFFAAWVPVVVALFVGVTFLLYKEDG